MRVGRALQCTDLPRECPFETRDETAPEHIWLQSKIKLKIHHWRSSPEPPELAGFYVDSVKF